MKMIKYTIICILALMLYGCGPCRWYSIGDGVLIYTSQKLDVPHTYTWTGETFDNIAVGHGSLVKFHGSKKSVLVKNCYAVWGNIDGIDEKDEIAIFEGSDKKINGFAVVQKNENLYIGYFQNNKQHGPLKYYKNYDLRYDGLWQEGKRHGPGKIPVDDDTLYGVWDNDVLIRSIRLPWQGGYYKGELNRGIPNGKGTYASETFSYEGQWINGAWNGLGTYETDDFVYTGEWKNGAMEGLGRVIFQSGSIYEGEFKQNHFNGKGSFTFADGTTYVGIFANGTYKGYNNATMQVTQKSLPQKSGQRAIIEHKADKMGTGILFNLLNIDISKVIQTIKELSPFSFNPDLPVNPYFKTVNYSHADLVSTAISIPFRILGVVAKKAVGTGAKKVAQKTASSVAKKAVSSGAKRAASSGIKKAASSGVKKAATSTATKALANKAPAAARKAHSVQAAASKSRELALNKNIIETSKKPVLVAANSGAKAVQSSLASIEKEVMAIHSKGPITISDDMMKKLLDHPEYLRNYVKATTGAPSFGAGYKEFFIRVANDKKENISKLLSNPTIKEMTNNAIRKKGSPDGHKHEWLMTKNAKYFLTEPSLGDNGPKLFYSLDKFVQGTKNVQLKNGITHYDGGKDVVAFHEGLSKIIESEKSGDIRVIGSRIKQYAQNELTTESYRDFLQMFNSIFR